MIALVPYDPKWAEQYELVAGQLGAILADWPHVIEHVGSTSIPGIPAAKPIIDIIVAVDGQSINDDRLKNTLIGAGFKHISDSVPESISVRHIFANPKIPPANVHVVVRNEDFWRRMIMFRDWLRGHPEVAQRYAEFKTGLATDVSRKEYGRRKAPYIESVEDSALNKLRANDPDVTYPPLEVHSMDYVSNPDLPIWSPVSSPTAPLGSIDNPIIGNNVNVYFTLPDGGMNYEPVPPATQIETYQDGGGNWHVDGV